MRHPTNEPSPKGGIEALRGRCCGSIRSRAFGHHDGTEDSCPSQKNTLLHRQRPWSRGPVRTPNEEGGKKGGAGLQVTSGRGLGTVINPQLLAARRSVCAGFRHPTKLAERRPIAALQHSNVSIDRSLVCPFCSFSFARHFSFSCCFSLFIAAMYVRICSQRLVVFGVLSKLSYLSSDRLVRKKYNTR